MCLLINGSVGDFYRTTVGVGQGCRIIFSTIKNIFLERIVQMALTPQHQSENDCFADIAAECAEEIDIHQLSLSMGGRPLCNLRFATDIDLLGGREEELQQLTDRLEKTAAECGMEISSDKRKIPINSIKS